MLNNLTSSLAPKVEDVILNLWKEGDILVYALTGQAGGGKTTTADQVICNLQSQDLPAAKLGLDTYFILSSKQRKVWLKEGELVSPEEGSRRRNQLTWWDFGKLESDLKLLCQGEPLRLRNVYNRADGGELTGSADIVPHPYRGLIVILEGVALAHVEGVKERGYIHAPAPIRYERLQERDANRRMSEDEAWARFRLTQEFETDYFRNHWKKIHRFFDNSNGHGVIQLPNLDPTEALADLKIPPRKQSSQSLYA